MQVGKPSRTAWAAAAHRVAHQILEGGRIFADPLALRILGEAAETVVRGAVPVCLRADSESASQLFSPGAGLSTALIRAPAMRSRTTRPIPGAPDREEWRCTPKGVHPGHGRTRTRRASRQTRSVRLPTSADCPGE